MKQYLRRMAVSAWGEGDHYTLSLRALSKNKAMLTVEDEMVWARERFRAACAARAIRTCQDAERHYICIRDARAAVVREGQQYIDRWQRLLTSCSAAGRAGGPSGQPAAGGRFV